MTAPLLFRAVVGQKIKYFINVGPYIGFLIKKESVWTGDSIARTSYDETALNKKSDYGISSGLGVLVPIRNRFGVSIELRNNLGLTNVSAVPVFADGSIKTNSTNLLISFVYKLGIKNE